MERQYEYGLTRVLYSFFTFVFGVDAIGLAAKAGGNSDMLTLPGIELSPDAATVFYWVLAGVSLGIALVAGFFAILALTLHQRILLTDRCVTVPRSQWSYKERTVPFCDIVELVMSQGFCQRFLKIVYNGGKFTLAASMLSRKEDFDEISEAIGHLVNASRGRQARDTFPETAFHPFSRASSIPGAVPPGPQIPAAD